MTTTVPATGRAGSGRVSVIPVSSRADLKRFIEYPYRKYRNDPVWVPPLLVSEWETFNPQKNPFYAHADVQLFLAVDGDRVTGRIAAIHDRNYIEFHEEPVALFAHFEAEGPAETRALLEAAEAWASARGLSIVRGPSKAEQNDMVGLLVENFEDPPAIMMPYNPPEYREWIEAAGYAKSEDTFAWRMFSKNGLPERVARIAKVVEKNFERRGHRLVVRKVDFKNLDREVDVVRDIYNRAWDRNWGFVPWTEAEINHMKDNLKLVADKDVCMIVEVDGQPVAFSIMVPDINQLLRGTGGRLFPLGLPKLLLGKAKRSRLMALGIVPEFRARGVDAVLYAESFWRGTKKYSAGEFGWTLESNTGITEGMKALGAEPYKRYRIFEKRLDAK